MDQRTDYRRYRTRLGLWVERWLEADERLPDVENEVVTLWTELELEQPVKALEINR